MESTSMLTTGEMAYAPAGLARPQMGQSEFVCAWSASIVAPKPVIFDGTNHTSTRRPRESSP
jgi:hypothetical protein